MFETFIAFRRDSHGCFQDILLMSGKEEAESGTGNQFL